jgi:hypothetical protein
MTEAPNSRAVLERRRTDGGLKWSRAVTIVRRLLPFVVAHWLMDGAASATGSLLPLLR